MIELSIHHTKKIEMGEPKEFPQESSTPRFWVRKINVVRDDGDNVTITVFGDNKEDVCL